MPDNSMRGPDRQAELHRASAIFMLSTLVVAELAAAFETSMIIAGMKQLLTLFGRPVAIGWLLTSYLLVASGAAALGGRLGDLFGRRLMLQVSLGFAVTGSLVSAFSTSLEGIIIGRGIQGLSGGILPLCMGLLKENLPERRVPLGIGIISSTAAAGAGGGLVLGGILVDYGHWSLIFHASALTAFLALVLSFFAIPRSPRKIHSLRNADLLAGGLFVPPVALLLYAISNFVTYGWANPAIWSAIAISLVALAFWARHEWRHPNPLISIRLLTYRPIAIANLATIGIGMSGSAFPQFLILMVQQPVAMGVGLGVTATLAGIIKLPGNICSTLTAPIAGQLIGRFGARTAFLIGTPLATIGYLAFIPLSQNLAAVIVLSALVTVGTTLMIVGTPSIILKHAPADRASEAIGVMTVVRSIFMAVGVQMTMVTLSMYTPAASAHPAPEGFHIVLGLLALINVLGGAVVLFFLPREKRFAQPAPATDT